MDSYHPFTVPSEPRKRVRRACEYCRKKRLKCTADRHPCMNCELYSAECIVTPEAPKDSKRRRRPKPTPTDEDESRAPGPPGSVGETYSPTANDNDGTTGKDERRDLVGMNPSFLLSTDTPYLGRAGLSALEQAISDGGIDVAQEFWELDSFIASCNPPDENAAAEQLLALQSPPETLTLPSHRSASRPSAGQVYGVEGLASPPTSTSGASPGIVSSGIFSSKGEGNSHFFGFTSTAATIALCIRDATDPRHRLAESESLGFIVDCGRMCDEISVADSKDLPSPSTTLAAHIFEDYHAVYPILHRPEIDQLLERYVCHGQRSLSRLEQSLLYLVNAIGASSRPGMEISKLVDADNLYALAWAMFPYVAATPSLESMQILLLHVCSLQHPLEQMEHRVGPLWDRSASRSGRGPAPRITARLRSGTQPAEVARATLGRSTGSRRGRPPGCQQIQWDPELFTNLHVSELRWPLSEILQWRVSLALIQQRVNMTFSSIATEKDRFRYLQEIDAQLIRWKEELPPELQPEQQAILDSDAHIDVYMLHLDYFNLLQTIHWALINHGPKPSELTTPRLRASESICLGACLALVRTFNAMTDGDTRARSFRARSDHFLSAMAIIYRDIARHPSKFSARTNLEYLRVIKLHLGRMAHQHLLSASLTRLFEEMVKGAEELVRDGSSAQLLGQFRKGPNGTSRIIATDHPVVDHRPQPVPVGLPELDHQPSRLKRHRVRVGSRNELAGQYQHAEASFRVVDSNGRVDLVCGPVRGQRVDATGNYNAVRARADNDRVAQQAKAQMEEDLGDQNLARVRSRRALWEMVGVEERFEHGKERAELRHLRVRVPVWNASLVAQKVDILRAAIGYCGSEDNQSEVGCSVKTRTQDAFVWAPKTPMMSRFKGLQEENRRLRGIIKRLKKSYKVVLEEKQELAAEIQDAAEATARLERAIQKIRHQYNTY
ncbi:hypothetical protein FE257_006708 [Aspergillus nanangensis]|uniref:Zn(2)-C6 fungal-type domain-containing protein n=1 Tax=Aspergillus nanangensis TaxID=2582783 RepID=A0AAD4CQM6_ASPNN|nr:hypothetical protein FE257_006708 [Aspergillus nanangensis]